MDDENQGVADVGGLMKTSKKPAADVHLWMSG